jgi:predicted CXXCH cytochrome family protein
MRYLLSLVLLLSCGAAWAQDSSVTDQLGALHSRANFHPGGSNPGRSSFDGLPTYHNEDALVCSDCHSMHFSQQHDYDGGTDPGPFASGGYPWSAQPNTKLLKADNSLDLCLACHDDQVGIPDVVGADVNNLTQRSGGHFGEPDTNPPYGHNLGYIPESLKGGFNMCMRCHFGGTFATAQVECIDCHNKHGNGKARNLQWASYPGGEPEFGLLMDPAVGSSFGNLARYERENVRYGSQDSIYMVEPSNMCIDCHHVFSGVLYTDPNNDGLHERHPAYDVERNDLNHIAQGDSKGSTNSAHWEAGVGAGFGVQRVRYVTTNAVDYADAGVISGARNGVLCLSCHYAHGSDQPFSLLWDPEDQGPNGCDQCHAKSAY